MFSRKPLHYQTSECDCVPTSIINALMWMFHDIPPEVTKSIWEFSLDGGGRGGTGYARQNALIMYLNVISGDPLDFKNFGVEIEEIELPTKAKQMARAITKCFKEDGVVLASVWYGCDPHMTLILGEDDEYYYLFDSYWRQTQWRDPAVEWSANGFFCDNIPLEVAMIANTRVKKSRLLSRHTTTFSIGNDSLFTVRYAPVLFKNLRVV